MVWLLGLVLPLILPCLQLTVQAAPSFGPPLIRSLAGRGLGGECSHSFWCVVLESLTSDTQGLAILEMGVLEDW